MYSANCERMLSDEPILGEKTMTQHPHVEDTLEDQAIMRRLAIVVGCFIAFIAVMALGIGITMG